VSTRPPEFPPGTDVAVAGTDVIATNATKGIIDGVFSEAPEQLLLAAPTAPEAVAADVATGDLVTSSTAVENTSVLAARQPRAFTIASEEATDVAAVAPRKPFAIDVADASVQEGANGELIITNSTAPKAEALTVDSVATPADLSSNAVTIDSTATADSLTAANPSTALVPYSANSTLAADVTDNALAANVTDNTLTTNLSEISTTANSTAVVEDATPLLPQVAQDSAVLDGVASSQILPSLTVTSAVAAIATDALNMETKPEAPVANTTDFTPPTVPNDKIIDLATVRVGEGPFMSAERILAAASGKRPDIKEVKELTAVLKRYFSPERNGNKGMDGLKVKYQFITKENFADIVAEVADPDVKTALMQFAMAS